jgi:DNA-binding SARP family transcriptional activator
MGAVRFAILGPLSVTDDGRDVPITAGRDRVVLAMLLLHQGLIVSANDLIDAVWAETPPATARGQLQTCVSRLRRMLPSTTIQTHPEGYGVKLGADELDAGTFIRLIAEARAESAPDVARDRLRAALDLWRGAALAGIDSRPVRQAAAVLDEQYAAVIEDWIDLELERGRARDLLAELTGLVERFWMRERLRAQLMVALSRVGRQADALAEYRRGRDILRAELGIEPSAALQDVHRRLLAGDAGRPAEAGPAGTEQIGSVSGPGSSSGSCGRPSPQRRRRTWRSSTGWRAAARRPWPCTSPACSGRGSRTLSSSSTCRGTARRARSSRPRRWSRCCGSSASRPTGSRTTRWNEPGYGRARSVPDGPSWCSTTPPPPPRSRRCCRRTARWSC